jgi:hypothetical protein
LISCRKRDGLWCDRLAANHRANRNERDRADERETALDITNGERAAFRLLGVEPGASVEDLRRAHRARVKTAHPDLGGSEDEWHELEEAHETALAWTRNRLLPVPRAGMELSERQGRELVRLDRHRQARAEADEVRDGLIQVHTSKLAGLKRNAWTLAGISAAATALAALLRSVAVPPLNSPDSRAAAVMFGVLAVAAAAFGLAGLVYRMRAEAVEMLVSAANEFVADRPSCLVLLDELERVGKTRAPWSLDELRRCVDRWASVGHGESESAAQLAARIGPVDFTKLLVARAQANELLEERFDDVGAAGRSVVYVRRLPGAE